MVKSVIKILTRKRIISVFAKKIKLKLCQFSNNNGNKIAKHMIPETSVCLKILIISFLLENAILKRKIINITQIKTIDCDIDKSKISKIKMTN